LGGDHNRSTIKEFYGACEEHRTASMLIPTKSPAHSEIMSPGIPT
jgi:hypothetical protein